MIGSSFGEADSGKKPKSHRSELSTNNTCRTRTIYIDLPTLLVVAFKWSDKVNSYEPLFRISQTKCAHHKGMRICIMNVKKNTFIHTTKNKTSIAVSLK